MNGPTVGVAVPMRNAERWIDEMISSVRAQTFPNWRLVVVDDGSGDTSLSVARQYEREDSRIEVTSGPGVGLGAPLTRSYGRARLGPGHTYLYFPDADDVLEPSLLSSLVARLERCTSAVAAFCRYSRIDEAGVELAEPPPSRIAPSRRWTRLIPDDDPVTPFETIYGWAAPAMEPVTMFRAASYDAAGGWEGWPQQFGESIDLLCRMALSGPVLFEPTALYRYRRHSGQFTADDERLSSAAQAIRDSWKERAAVDASVRPAVARAEFFVEHRLAPRIGLQAAWRHARSGRVVSAARFLGGAVRRYRWRESEEPAC